MSKHLVAVALALAFASASAKDFEVTGRGSAAVSAGNPQTVKALSFAAAKRQALIAGINRVNGPDSVRKPEVAAKVAAILDQIPDERFVNRRSQAVGDQFETTVTLLMDDKEFKTLLLDAGIAANVTTARSFSVLAVMDEYFTTPTDLKAPLEELEEFSYDARSSYREKSRSAQSSRESSASLSGRADAAAYDDGYGSAGAASASVDASASSSSSASRSATSIAADERERVRYRKLVRYQPQNRGPEKSSLTYNAFKAELQDLDLKVLDNDMFKSRYFKNAPITIEQMQQSAQLAKYVGFARSDAKADFFMLGNSVLIDAGRNSATGEAVCTGVLTIKTFSTSSGEDIASETTSQTASGANPNDCAANLARKLAATGGTMVGARIQEFWKRRNTYGREFVVALQGNGLVDAATRSLLRAVKAVPGVDKATLRSQTDQRYELVVVYKGDGFKDALDDQLDALPAFAARHSRVENDQVLICMAACPSSAAPDAPKGRKK